MGLRDAIRKNPAIVAGLAVVVLIGAALAVAYQFRTPSNHQPDVYFYDLGTRQLIAVKVDQLPPIAAPSGNGQTAVRAYVYSCGDCADAGKRQIYYLETYTPEAKKILAGLNAPPPRPIPPPDMSRTLSQGHLIRGVDQTDWVRADGPEGAKIMQSNQGKCGDAPVKTCLPGQ